MMASRMTSNANRLIYLICFVTFVNVHTIIALSDVDSQKRTDNHNADSANRESKLDDIGDNFYSHNVTDIDGNNVDLNEYKKKVSLVVNVASECGYTASHYLQLNTLHKSLSKTKKFNVLAFPCNQFGKQEPGTNFQIKQFAREIYRTKFPLFAKINVLEDNVPPAWQYLTKATKQEPNWNFWKYLVDADGHVLNFWGPWISVEDVEEEIKAAVKKCSIKYLHDEEL